MKKIFAAVLCVLYCGGAFAVQSISGDYVIYKDNTFVAETRIGFLRYDANTYGAVLYTPKENRRISVLFTVTTENGTMELTGQNVLTKTAMDNKADVEAVNYLMQMLPALYRWGETAKAQRKKQDGSIFYSSLSVDASYLGGNAEVKTASFIPLFGIEKIIDKQKRTLVELDRIGRLTASEGEFFNFKLPFEKEKQPMLVLDKNAKPDTKKIGSVKIKLDNHWEAIAENAYLLGDSAYLAVSTLEKKASITQEELAAFFLLSTGARVVPFDTVKITGNAKHFTVTADIYDTESQAVNIDKKTVVISGNSVTLISLTVAKADYLANRRYFDTLF